MKLIHGNENLIFSTYEHAIFQTLCSSGVYEKEKSDRCSLSEVQIKM